MKYYDRCKDFTQDQSHYDRNYISLEEYRKWQRSQIAQLLKERPNKVILINTPPGVGKTEELARQLKKSSRSVFWEAPNHLQAKQVSEIWGDEAVHLKSRNWMINNNEIQCPYANEVEHAISKQLPLGIYCNKKCPEYPCIYHSLRNSAKEKRLVIAMHQHQLVDTPALLDKDIVVFDENPASNLRVIKEIYKKDLVSSLGLASCITNKQVREFILSVLNSLKETGQMPSQITGDIPEINRNAINRDIATNYNKSETLQGTWILQDIMYIMKNQVPIYDTGRTLKYVKETWIPKDRPVFILDSTHTLKTIKTLLPDHDIMEIAKPNGVLEQQVEVIHVYGASYKISTLVSGKKVSPSGKRILNGIEKRFGSKCAIITAKRFEETASLKDRFEQVDHFGNTRGRNDFKNAKDLIIIGFWLKPLDVMLKEAMNQSGIIDYPFDEYFESARNDLHNSKQQKNIAEDGTEYLVTQYEFSNRYLDSYFEYAIEAELTQAVGRARVFEPSEYPRKLWVITDVLPKFVRVNRAMHYSEFLISRTDKNVELVRLGMEQAANPHSTKDIHHTLKSMGYNISKRTVQKYKTLIESMNNN